MHERHKAPIFKLDPDERRILEALLYLISEAEKRKESATQYVLVKSLFIADRNHLNSFGRPITFDNYVAMNHGPVPSKAYSMLSDKFDFKKAFGIAGVPWKKTQSKFNIKAFEFSRAFRGPDLDVLSESDVAALDDALTVVTSLTFSQLRKLTHEDQAYVNAWEDNGTKKAYPMSYALLFETPDYDQAENIVFASKHS